MNTKIFKLFGFGLMSGIVLTSCSDSFLEDKKSYDYVSPDAYNDYTGALLRVNDIYVRCLPDVNDDIKYWNTSTGSNDNAGKSTEEYSGLSDFVNGTQNPLNVMSGTKVPDLFFGSMNNVRENTYGHIRNINEVIEGISGSTLSDEEKNELLGQCYFFRAWRYYNMVKFYGGVPIVTEVQDPVEGVVNPRNTTKECIDFMLDDLDKAAKMMAESTMNGGAQEYGRVTTGTALALKGRVLLLWASPLFNRDNDQTRWQNAYTQMKAELDSINACGYGLYTDGDNVNGSTFARVFTQCQNANPEAVFVTLYNNSNIDGDVAKNSRWERSIRPANTSGSGKTASAMLVDMFPMADGKRPATANTYTKLDASSYSYDKEYPFMNRDPRFYRTFAFPGFRWAYQGNSTLTEKQPNSPSYNNGQDYELWNYVWYSSEEDRDKVNGGDEYGADNLLTDVQGVYVRKRSDDLDINSSPLYANFDATNTEKGGGGFAFSAQPYMEIRYAEVLLNLAEAACGAEDMAYAVQLLQQIRARAGYTSENNYGLQANLASDQAACMSAILYERQIEFAYEGKRFDDCRRWLLYDGGQYFSQIDGAPSAWTLTGWGGNTCTWLGFTPLNGQRRENMYFRVNNNHSNGVGGTTYDSDPIADVTRCAAVDLREDLTTQLETLKTWYADNLVRKDKKGDGQTSQQVDLYINFLPRYYFLGLPQGALNNMASVDQTIGWEDPHNGGANGTFDPLAE